VDIDPLCGQVGKTGRFAGAASHAAAVPSRLAADDHHLLAEIGSIYEWTPKAAARDREARRGRLCERLTITTIRLYRDELALKLIISDTR